MRGYTTIFVLKMGIVFPGGSVGKNFPANAGDTGLIPDLGISHMLQLSPSVMTIKSVL